MPTPRELDPNAGLINFFGAELRRWRTAAELSQEQLGSRFGYSGAQVGKVETGERAPSKHFAQGADKALPGADGLFMRLYELTLALDGGTSGYPSWFGAWLEAERRAAGICWWEPLLVPGLVQTADYARALFQAWRSADDGDELDTLVSARLDRQRIFDRPSPPSLWVIVDEAVLHRCIGSRKVMYDQLTHMVNLADRARFTIQVVPAEVGAHVGLLGAFAIANTDSAAPSIVYLESPDQGQTTELPHVVAKVTGTFDTLRAEALPRAASRDLIRKVAEEQWAPT